MKQFYTALLLIPVFLMAIPAGAQQVIKFSFEGSNGDEASWPSSYQTTGIQQSAITRGSGITASANADRFNSKDWTTSANIDLNDYLEFTITPQPGVGFTVSDITIQHQRSSSGPTQFVIRTSRDAFAANATNIVTIPDVNTLQSSSFSFIAPVTTSSPLTIRIYAFSAELANGTWGPGESLDGQDMQVAGAMLLLPVKLAQLVAVDLEKKIALSWMNLTESNVDSYIVERSSDGSSFWPLVKLMAVKNNGGQVNYTFDDSNPSGTILYYRIKAVEWNGSTVYSRVIRLERKGRNTSMALYPNPVQRGSQVVVTLKTDRAGSLNFEVWTITGQLKATQQVAVSAGAGVYTLETGTLVPGVYVIRVAGMLQQQQTLVVQ
ncbi:MAG TPA: T9SS type A sorting domain-containing protein [Flavisolibacter sp.]|jgi:hypothetical protein|nr:T9SS type A sorting domain-containing protein [Flavisolibacter sp.]